MPLPKFHFSCVLSVTTIAVKNWERFQHYGNREPTWIKLYRDLLTSEPWVLGTDLSRLVQVAITLLAARYQNAIPYDWGLIKKVAGLDCKEKDFRGAVNFLTTQNFLEIQQRTNGSEHVEHSASAVLAPCYAREEEDLKERKDKKERKEETRAQDAPPDSVPGLDLEAWESWISYRTKIRKPLNAASIPSAQRQLAKHGEAQSAVVEQSIANGWTGLFELKITNGTGTHKPTVKAKSIEELEAEEAARVQH
jgi:hypothetical protein